MGSHCFLFCRVRILETDGGNGSTKCDWTYATELYTLKMVKMVNFILYVTYTTAFKKIKLLLVSQYEVVM